MATATHTLKELERPLTRWRTDPETGARTRMSDGVTTADIELTVNLEMIARVLGVKAMRNKTGKASMAHGAIRVRAVNKRDWA